MLQFFKKLFKRREAEVPPLGAVPEPRPEEAPVEPRHFGLKLNGVSGFVLNTKEHGYRVVISGWNQHHWQWNVGDYLIIYQQGLPDTRYRIEHINRPGDPSDQYFAHCRFAPRGNRRES